MSKQIGRVFGLFTWGTAIVAVCVLVTIWALARPDADPVTRTAALALDKITALAAPLWRDRAQTTPDWSAAALQVLDGDPVEGAELIRNFGCGACHAIPGIPRAQGSVGPDLAGFRDQAYIAGVLPNRPGDLVNWLQSPPLHAPRTAMPDMGVSEAQAADMAAYLYTLEGR